MTDGPEIKLSRAARIAAVDIAAQVDGPDQLPIVALTVCVPEVDQLPHEHVTVGLTPDVLDALIEARTKLAELATR